MFALTEKKVKRIVEEEIRHALSKNGLIGLSLDVANQAAELKDRVDALQGDFREADMAIGRTEIKTGQLKAELDKVKAKVDGK